jgi:hypothetical protein
MQIKTKNRISPSYRFTVDMNNPNDVELVNNLRKNIQTMNSKKWMLRKQRVCLKGRLGQNNPNATKYRNSTSWNPYQTILKADAGHFDVYVYNRYE